MREYAANFGQQVQDYWNSRFGSGPHGRDEAEPPAPEPTPSTTVPGNTVTAAQLEPQQIQERPQGMVQSL